MKQIIFFAIVLCCSCASIAQGENENPSFATSDDLKISNASIVFDERLDQLIFTIQVEGRAGRATPKAIGKMDGAPVLGYVFPTTLKSTDVGFGVTEGIVALAVTSHPDFDDTPLWDENNDFDYANDGVVWHPHWVVLVKDSRVAGGLSVKQFDPSIDSVILPPTNPGMPMYMDSPGHPVITKGSTIRVVVPANRMNNQTDFNFDAVTVYMQVNGSNLDMPMLGVYSVYFIASGNLSLPYKVSH